MRAVFVFIAAALAFDVDDSPTYDPEEQGIALMDEYATEDDFVAPRILQANASNITMPPVPDQGGGIPWAPMLLAGVGLGGAGAAYYGLMGQTAETQTYEYTYDEEFIDEEDYEGYDEEYGYEEEFEEYE
jgi:hypothetical protein